MDNEEWLTDAAQHKNDYKTLVTEYAEDAVYVECIRHISRPVCERPSSEEEWQYELFQCPQMMFTSKWPSPCREKGCHNTRNLEFDTNTSEFHHSRVEEIFQLK